jgi:hypothetical protein
MLLYFIIALLFSLDIYRTLNPHDFQKNKTNITLFLQPKLITVSYKILYFYSYLQIKYTKFKIFIMPFINILAVAISNLLKKHNLINFSEPPPKLVFELYGKGVKLKNIFLHDENNNEIHNIINKELKLCSNDFDLVIMSDQIDKSCCTNKIHFYNLADSSYNLNYDISKIKFMSMELIYNNQTYPIELQNDYYNHYIINNKLNSDFYQYYLTNILKVPIKPDVFDYKIQLLDHNVNLIELTSQQEIIIKENDYEIINIQKNVEVLLNEDVDNEDNDDNLNKEYTENIESIQMHEPVEELESAIDTDYSNDYIKLDLSEYR